MRRRTTIKRTYCYACSPQCYWDRSRAWIKFADSRSLQIRAESLARFRELLLAAMILEMVLMNKNCLHPWMYITIYTVGAMFAALLFPPDSMGPWKWMTWGFAKFEWMVCAACIVHGILVARQLGREREQEADY